MLVRNLCRVFEKHKYTTFVDVKLTLICFFYPIVTEALFTLPPSGGLSLVTVTVACVTVGKCVVSASRRL